MALKYYSITPVTKSKNCAVLHINSSVHLVSIVLNHPVYIIGQFALFIILVCVNECGTLFISPIISWFYFLLDEQPTTKILQH